MTRDRTDDARHRTDDADTRRDATDLEVGLGELRGPDAHSGQSEPHTAGSEPHAAGSEPHAAGSESHAARTVAGRVNRRDYLRALGAVGGAGMAAASTAVPASAQDGWEAAAEQRIQEHRTGQLTVEVVDQDGEPVSGAAVDLEMRDHDYWFGNVLSADLLVNETEPGHPYRESLKDDFNVVWFGNHHKWRFFEDEREIADEATAWAKDNGLDIRGHTCLWANVGAWAVPGDVVDAMGLDHESGESGPDLDATHVRNRTFDHVQEIVEHYADFEYDGTSYGSVIDEWEVANEVVHEPGLIRAVDGVPADQEASELDPVTAPVLAEWYRHARDAAPDDVGLAVNDYNTMEGSHEYARSDYERQIEFLADDGQLDYAGIQSHFGEQDTAVTPQEAMDVLDRYAQHGVRLRVTEYDATGDDWTDQEKAEFFNDYLKTVFSHEATDAFLVAGGSDEHHWRDDDPFFYEGWEPKPAYEEYDDLVFGEWWTSESDATDGDGTVTVDAFYGEFDVTVAAGGQQRSVEVSHVAEQGDGTRAVVSLDVEAGEPCADAAGGSTEVDGQTVCDVTDDGYYRDVTADGNVGQGDVAEFFTKQHRSAWKRAELFDFSENGAVTHGDVVELFDYVALNG